MKFSQWFENKYLEWQLSEGGRKTLEEFGSYLGVSQPTVSSWLNGRREPTGWNVDKIAARLGPEVYEVLGLERPEIYDPQLYQLIEAYHQASAEQKEYLLKQALRLIGFEPE